MSEYDSQNETPAQAIPAEQPAEAEPQVGTDAVAADGENVVDGISEEEVLPPDTTDASATEEQAVGESSDEEE